MLRKLQCSLWKPPLIYCNHYLTSAPPKQSARLYFVICIENTYKYRKVSVLLEGIISDRRFVGKKQIKKFEYKQKSVKEKRKTNHLFALDVSTTYYATLQPLLVIVS